MYYLASGTSQLFYINAANVIGTVANSNYAAYANVANTANTTNVAANMSVSGTGIPGGVHIESVDTVNTKITLPQVW